MHNGYKEVADSMKTQHCGDGNASNASNAQQGASHAQEVAPWHTSVRADTVEEGIESKDGLEEVVPKDKNDHGSLAAGRRTHRTDGRPTTRACSHAM